MTHDLLFVFGSCSFPTFTHTRINTNAQKSGGGVSATGITSLPARTLWITRLRCRKLHLYLISFKLRTTKSFSNSAGSAAHCFAFFCSALCFLSFFHLLLSRSFLSPSVPRHSYSPPTPSVLSLFSFISVSHSLFCAAGLEMFELNGCLRCRRNGI